LSAEETPEETVANFLAMWDGPDGFVDAIRRYFTDRTRYENVGMSFTTGVDEALAFAEGFEAATGKGIRIRVTTLASAVNGNTVMNERIDEVIARDGNVITTIRLMGVFHVSGGKIAEWRDYFDTAGLTASLGG